MKYKSAHQTVWTAKQISMSNLNFLARISFLPYFVSSVKSHLLIMNLNMDHGESRRSSFYKAYSKISKEDGSEDKEMADNETQTLSKQFKGYNYIVTIILKTV